MKTRLIAGVLACIVAAALAACGGGGGGGGGGATAAAPDTPSVPASAFASVDGFVAYLQQLVASTSETSEPLALPDGAAPTTDTSDPAPAG